MSSSGFEVPQHLRDTAERSVEQAKEAFDRFLDATGDAVATSEGAGRTMSENAAGVSRKTLSFMGDSLSATFDLAQRMVQARTMEEIAALQQEFVRQQAANMARQGQELGEAMTRMAADAVKTGKK